MISLVYGRPRIGTSIKPLEADVLELAATGRRVLEIGSAWGFSTVLMALVAQEVVSIDPHTMADTWQPFVDNLAEYGVTRKVTAYRMRSQDVLGRLYKAGQRFELAFIDGEHTFEACAFDISWALLLVEPGGIIAVHDYCVRWPGVIEAVEGRLIKRGSGFEAFPAWRIQDLYLAAL